MAWLRQFQEHNQRPCLESPAKIFAKLKSKVQNEAARVRENLDDDRDNRRDEFSRKENFCPAEDVEGNIRIKAHGGGLQSPLFTPRKKYPTFDGVDETSLVSEHGFMARHLHTPTRKMDLNSTPVFKPPVTKMRPQTTDGFIKRSPSKAHHTENGHARGGVSPSEMKLPRLEVSLTKRNLEPHETYRVYDNGRVAAIPAQDRKSSTDNKFSGKTPKEAVRDMFEFPPGVNDAPVFTSPRPTPVKRCVDNAPPRTPAKTFALMKERESSKDQRADRAVGDSTRMLFKEDDHFHQKRDRHPRTTHHADPDNVFPDSVFPDSVCPDGHSKEELADSQSDPREDAPFTIDTPLPVLLEDSLVLNTPKVNMPKKILTGPRNKKCQQKIFPDEGDIYLKKWFLRKHKKGLFLDGLNIKDNVPWNSNIVTDRVSNSVVKTISGKVYVLIGKMSLNAGSDFPLWFLRKFVNGFPLNWKSIHEKFLTDDSVKTSKGNSTLAKAPAKQSVKQTRQNTFKTPQSCPTAVSASTCPKTSRSGRLIKPPLEYWRGGRVSLDADMNVTIHDSYDTSICVSEVSPPVCAQRSKGPLLLCSEGRKPSETAFSEAKSAPVRKVRPPVRQRNRAETLVNTTSSPEETFRRRTRSQSRSPPQQVTTNLDTVPQKHKETERVTRAKPKSSDEWKRKSANAAHNKRTEAPSYARSMSKPSDSSRRHKSSKGRTVALQEEEDEDEWTEAELKRLQEAVSHFPVHTWDYWGKVANMVGSRSAIECHNRHTLQGASQSPTKKPRKPRKDKEELAKDPVTDLPVISAREGTLRRRQQVRQLLEALPTEDMDDVFSSARMRENRFQMSSICPNKDVDDHDIQMPNLEPLTPTSRNYPELKTPQCLHISPGMMGCPDMDNNDKYIYRLQKRMRRNRFNVGKQPQLSKKFAPSPSAKRTMRRCGNTENNTFVVWEMSPGNGAEPSDSEDEQDFYFSDT